MHSVKSGTALFILRIDLQKTAIVFATFHISGFVQNYTV